MSKIVIFDSGIGGELFADYVAAEIPTLEIIRVIDWRHADSYLLSKKSARKAAMEALRPYIGTVDLIVFANFLLSITSLKYFRRKFKNQKFSGFNLNFKHSRSPALVLTTSAVRRTRPFHALEKSCSYPDILVCDTWPNLIDDGELSSAEVRSMLSKITTTPRQIILACTHFSDLIPTLRQITARPIKINDGFHRALIEACHALKLRGYYHKNK